MLTSLPVNCIPYSHVQGQTWAALYIESGRQFFLVLRLFRPAVHKLRLL